MVEVSLEPKQHIVRSQSYTLYSCTPILCDWLRQCYVQPYKTQAAKLYKLSSHINSNQHIWRHLHRVHTMQSRTLGTSDNSTQAGNSFQQWNWVLTFIFFDILHDEQFISNRVSSLSVLLLMSVLKKTESVLFIE